MSSSGLPLKADLFPVPREQGFQMAIEKHKPIRGTGEIFVTKKRKPILWSTAGRDDGMGTGITGQWKTFPNVGEPSVWFS